MDLRLRQVAVAERLKVTPATIRLWEEGRATPGVRLMARVIAFIGCDATPAETSLPSRLRAYRRREGVTQRELSERLGVAVDTPVRWEWRGQKPRGTLGHRRAGARVGRTDPQDLPNRLRHIRRKLGLTQAEFGERLGLDQGCISDWERGRCEPLPCRRARLDRLLVKLDS